MLESAQGLNRLVWSLTCLPSELIASIDRHSLFRRAKLSSTIKGILTGYWRVLSQQCSQSEINEVPVVHVCYLLSMRIGTLKFSVTVHKRINPPHLSFITLFKDIPWPWVEFIAHLYHTGNHHHYKLFFFSKAKKNTWLSLLRSRPLWTLKANITFWISTLKPRNTWTLHVLLSVLGHDVCFKCCILSVWFYVILQSRGSVIRFL